MRCSGRLRARGKNLIIPILIGDAAKSAPSAASLGVNLSGIAIENAPNHDAAAARAVEMVHQGLVTAVMKGHLHTDELLSTLSSLKAACGSGAGSAMCSSWMRRRCLSCCS